MKLKFMSVLLMIGIILSFASCSGGSKEMMYKSKQDSYESEPQDGFWQMKYFNYSGYNDDMEMNYKMQYRSGDYLVTNFLDGVCINDYLGDEENVELPKKIKDKPVLKIGFKYYYDKIYDAYLTEFPFKDVSTLTISSTVKYIEPSFFECEWIDVNPYNEYYSSKDGILYSKSFDSLLMIPDGYQEETIEVKNGTKYVADAYSDNLMRMVIPESVEGFGFQNEDELHTNDNVVFDVSEKNKTYKSVDGVLYNKKTKDLLHYPGNNPAKEYVVDESTKTISADFYGVKNLTTLTIGKNVTEINITVHVDSEALELGYSIDEYNSTIKTIKGYKGTEAEKFAKENRLNFEPLD